MAPKGWLQNIGKKLARDNSRSGYSECKKFLLDEGFREIDDPGFDSPVFSFFNIDNVVRDYVVLRKDKSKKIVFKKDDLFVSIIYRDSFWLGRTNYIIVLSTRVRAKEQTLIVHREAPAPMFTKRSARREELAKRYLKYIMRYSSFRKGILPIASSSVRNLVDGLEMIELENEEFTEKYNIYTDDFSEALPRHVLDFDYIDSILSRDRSVEFEVKDGFLHLFDFQLNFDHSLFDTQLHTFQDLKERLV